jgi:hypothetical protein
VPCCTGLPPIAWPRQRPEAILKPEPAGIPVLVLLTSSSGPTS